MKSRLSNLPSKLNYHDAFQLLIIATGTLSHASGALSKKPEFKVILNDLKKALDSTNKALYDLQSDGIEPKVDTDSLYYGLTPHFMILVDLIGRLIGLIENSQEVDRYAK